MNRLAELERDVADLKGKVGTQALDYQPPNRSDAPSPYIPIKPDPAQTPDPAPKTDEVVVSRQQTWPVSSENSPMHRTESRVTSDS